MNQRKKLNQKKIRRVARTRARIQGTAERPRLVVNRSNRFIHVQLIDDAAQKTLAAASSIAAAKAKDAKKATKSEQAFAVGETIGKKAVALGVKAAVFDRRSYRFHGRVKQLAEGARKSGLKI
jgi:large subunit ribosomal protein L18